MSSGRELRKYPFLRLLIPLVSGIVVADFLFFAGIRFLTFCSFLPVILFFFVLLLAYFFRRYAFRQLFGFLVYGFFFAFGFTLTSHNLNDTEYFFPEKNTVYKAIITSNAETKARSVLYKAEIIEKYDSVSFPVNKKVLLYFPSDSVSATISRGDEIIFNGRISLPSMNGNPDEFNYPQYLMRKGISASGYVSSGNWRITSRRVTPPSLQERALRCRDSVLDIYKRSGFSGEEFAVLSALTVGYKEELSEEIRESFSISGVSHVLALSGLHVGFIFALLFFVLKKVFGTSRGALIVRVVFTIATLWLFAFMTGLSSSVVRSVLMFSLLTLSSVRSGVILTGHSLSLAAFLMLIYNPGWLYDVGFQLSFIAVLGIILIQPRLYSLWNIRGWAGRYIWGLLTVSAAAQIATAPLVIYYFSRFSTHFLLTNLVVIPLVTFIIYGAVILILAFPVPGLQQIIAIVLQFLVKTLNASVRWVEQLPYASIENLWITPMALLVVYFLLLLMVLNVKRKKAKNIILILCCIVFITGYSIWLDRNNRPQQTIAFYNIRECPAVHCITTERNSWLAYADSIPEYTRLNKSLSKYWIRHGLDEPEHVINDYRKENFMRVDNFISFSGKNIYILKDNRWNKKHSDNPLTIDYLYVCRGFTSSIESVLQSLSVRQVILDSSLPTYLRERLGQESVELNIPCVCLSDGAFIVEL